VDLQMVTIFAVAATMLSCIVTVCVLCVLCSVSKENRTLNKEMFGLVKRLEGLTAHRRDQVLTQFDKLVDTLASRIPTIVAASAGDRIFETESTILARLAELEPELASDEQKKKLDTLIQSMESLEKTLIAHTATAVHQVMLENRKTLFDEDEAAEIPFSQ
jgi:hypothetical protein